MESYRNYYGFDPPGDGPYFQPVQDNFGNWIRHYRNTSVVIRFGKRQGFRLTVAELERYKQLQADLEAAQTLSFGNLTGETQRIEQEIRELVESAQGEIATLVPREMIYYGDSTDPEQDRIINSEATRALYKRMGIEHLYKFYEVDPYK